MTYPLDITGENQLNRIPNELHTVTGINGTNIFYFHLDAAPFFSKNFALVDVATGNILTPGVDFVFGHKYEDLHYRLGIDVYGSIAFTDPTRSGTYATAYQTLGSTFVIAENQTLADGLSTLEAVQTIPWESIANVPTEFPPGIHNLPTADITGYQAFLDMLQELKDAVLSQSRDISISDVNDLETSFLVPLFDRMSEISAAILTAQIAGNVQYVQYSTHNEDSVIVTNPALGTWTDSGCAITIPSTGTWKLETRLNPEVTWVAGAGTVDTRWVVNGIPLTSAFCNDPVIGFTQGDVIKAQFRVRDAAATSVKMKSAVHESTLTAQKFVN